MPLTDRRRRAALEGTFLVDAEPGRDPRLRARAKADSPSGDGAKPRGRSKRSGLRVSSAVQRSCEQRRDPFNALHEQRWIVARAFVSEKGVRGVNLVPFIANADLFEPGANRLAPGERNMRILPTKYEQRFGFQIRHSREAVVAFARAKRARMDVGRIEASRRGNGRVKRRPIGEVAAEADTHRRKPPGAIGMLGKGRKAGLGV